MLRQRGRLMGLALTALLALAAYAASFAKNNPLESPRLYVFDTYQQLLPRERITAPVTIVAIDHESLDAFGRWPWPRDLIAELLRKIGEYEPAAIGIDILFLDADQSSRYVAKLAQDAPGEVSAWLLQRPSNDQKLAEAIKSLPVALGVAGLDITGGAGGSAAYAAGPITISRQRGPPALEQLKQHGGLLRSIPQIDAAAAGHGMIGVDIGQDGIVRRTPFVVLAGGALIPSLEVEMIRLASRRQWFTLQSGPEGVESVSAGKVNIPAQRDGAHWVHYGPSDPGRFVSAKSVLNGAADPVKLHKKLVLVGFTGLGLLDDRATPLGQMTGVEIRAQILESIADATLLRRPAWAGWAEAGMTLLFCGFLVVAVPAVRPRWTPVIWLSGGAVLAAAGFGAFAAYRLLLDIAVPAILASLQFLVVLAGTLAEADRQRRLYKRDLEIQREKEAKFAGELEAARRIQMGILPDASAIRDPLGRIDVAAMLEPAREVGGDLYDIFLIDGGERLFFMVGDVSGKGIPASLFMALGKSLYKSAVLRDRDSIALVMTEANAEIARDNPEQLFITAFAAILDLDNGRMMVSNAGHDWPVIKLPGGNVAAWGGAGGPPLCVLDDFDYPGEALQLTPGTVVVLFTDGVTEAMDPAGVSYGLERLTALIGDLPSGINARDVIDEIHADVKAHTLGAAASDDIAILVVIWKGEGAR